MTEGGLTPGGVARGIESAYELASDRDPEGISQGVNRMRLMLEVAGQLRREHPEGDIAVQKALDGSAPAARTLFAACAVMELDLLDFRVEVEGEEVG